MYMPKDVAMELSFDWLHMVLIQEGFHGEYYILTYGWGSGGAVGR